MKKMTYTLIVARLTMLSAGKSAYAQIPEAKNVPQDTVMYKTTYEVRQIIPPLYEAAGFFREGRARIKRDNKWGVLSFRIVKNEK
ncbi:hypothetical protein TFKS16_1319 [Tannerella forsythia KS16]|uniref:Uncharacterized protein n=1 Tax=Tannerella forsythia TaxID=28112 RepID=A0A1D3UHV2_TANFO|nr:WG repeat-containing protein [Tannerella forsythia]KKY61197.1 hypothetical protein Tanf_08760 [Tannerella forsythia]OLQ21050.1 hypothetical protein BGK60_05755 [Tannerella forsythia]PDP43051.1 hypothetical protein CLI86_10290 [Tannerella forsythia]PDP70693.1 hypothetical protein CLI85_08210 [Tannerella forsythia]TPE17720.1 WG repeat-containing protein [Tannerella forsythia]